MQRSLPVHSSLYNQASIYHFSPFSHRHARPCSLLSHFFTFIHLFHRLYSPRTPSRTPHTALYVKSSDSCFLSISIAAVVHPSLLFIHRIKLCEEAESGSYIVSFWCLWLHDAAITTTDPHFPAPLIHVKSLHTRERLREGGGTGGSACSHEANVTPALNRFYPVVRVLLGDGRERSLLRHHLFLLCEWSKQVCLSYLPGTSPPPG